MTKHHKKINKIKEKSMVLIREAKKYLNRISVPSFVKAIVNPTRVAALRKQYDAFLEEDKKRKERNEYILGRLDKMRSLSTAVKVQHKSNLPEDNRIKMSCVHPQTTEIQPFQYNTREYFLNTLVESELLNKISEKYILIPKRCNTNPEEHSQPVSAGIPVVKDNNDWKNKYKILDQLKKDEKESTNIVHANESVVAAQQPVTVALKEVPNDRNGYEINQKPQENCKYELNENSIDYVTNNITQKVFKNKENEEILQKSQERTQNASADSTGPVYDDFQEDFTQSTADTDVNVDKHNQIVYEDPSSHKYNTTEESPSTQDYCEKLYNEKLCYENTYQSNEIVDDKDDTISEKNTHRPQDDKILTEILNDTPLQEQDTESQLQLQSTENENIKYPIEKIHNEEFTPNDNVELQDNENIYPEEHPAYEIEESAGEQYDHDPQPAVENNVDLSETAADVSGIKEFEAEQEQMFYQENENSTYDQQISENAEYTAQENIPTVNDQYPYYEGTQQIYPEEINENEETTQHYDPSYETQYNTEYNYDQQQGYEQSSYEQQAAYDQQPAEYHQEQYDQQQGYDQHTLENQQSPHEQEQYDQLQSQQETVETVQQQLDKEQGYIDSQSNEMTQKQEEAQIANLKSS